MALTRRARRRLVLLGGLAVLLVASAGGLWAVQKSLKDSRAAAARIQGMADAANGNWRDALPNLSIVVSRNKNDFDALLAFAETRSQIPVPNSRHIQSALNLYVRAVGLGRGTGVPNEKLLEALVGKAKMEFALGNVKILQKTAFEILALEPTNSDALAFLYEIQSVRGDFLPSDWRLFVRGQWESDEAWLQANRDAGPGDPPALRWALERMMQEEQSLRRREDVLASIRSGGSLDLQRLQLVPIEDRESTIDITRIWAEAAAEDQVMFHLLLAREALRTDDRATARQAMKVVLERLGDETEMIVQSAEILAVLGEREELAEAEVLLARARKLAADDCDAATALTLRAWHKGRRADLSEMLRLEVSGEEEEILGFRLAAALVSSLDGSEDALGRIEDLKQMVTSSNQIKPWFLSVNLLVRLLEILNEVTPEGGETIDDGLDAVTAIAARFSNDALIQTVAGDILERSGRSGPALEAWSRGLMLQQYDSAPISRRLINGLLNDGSPHRAFKEAVEVTARMQTIESGILLCRAWLALEAAGIPSQSVVPGFDLAASPFEFAETIIEAIELGGGDTGRYLPLMVEAAVRSGRQGVANEFVDRALADDLEISVLLPLGQVSLRGNLGRETELLEAIVEADTENEFVDEIVILRASILRREGKAAEAFALSEGHFGQRTDARSKRLRQAEMLDSYIAGGVPAEEATSLILGIESADLDKKVLSRLLSALLDEGNRELSELILERLVLEYGEESEGSPDVALALARFTLAFDRELPEAVNAAILRLDPLVSAGIARVDHELVMVELLGLQTPPKITRAIEVLRESVRKRPGRFDTTLRLISFLQKSGRFQEADELLEGVWRRREAAPPAVRRLIPRLMSGQGDVDEIMASQCELAEETGDPVDLLACIRARYQAGAIEEADKGLDELMLLEVRPVAVDLEAAGRSVRRGDVDGAIEILEMALGFETELDKTRAIGSLLLRTNRLAELDSLIENLGESVGRSADIQILVCLRALRSDPPEVEKAKAAIGGALEVGSDRPEILQRILTIRVENPELRVDSDPAVDLLRRTNPEEAMLLGLAMRVPLVDGEFNPSVAQIAEAMAIIESQADSRAAWLLGVNLHLAVFEKALAGEWPTESDRPEGARLVGGESSESQRLPIALVDLLVAASSRFPGDMLFPVQLSEVYLRLGRGEEALSSAREGLRRAGGGRKLGNALPVAIIERRLNRPDLAVRTLESFRAAVEEDPASRPRAWRILVESLLLDGQVEEGWALFRAIGPKLDPRLLSSVWLETASTASPEIASKAIELARRALPPGLARLRLAGAGLAAFRRTGDASLEALTEEILTEIIASDSSAVATLQVELVRIGLIEAGAKLEAIQRYDKMLVGIPPAIMQDLLVFSSLSDERRAAAAPYVNSTLMAMNNLAAIIASMAIDGLLPLDEAPKWLDRAAEISVQMAAIAPDSQEMTDTRSMVAMATGDYSRAVDLAREAVSMNPERTAFRWTLVQALQANGDTEDAYTEAGKADRVLRRSLERDEELSLKLAAFLNGS